MNTIRFSDCKEELLKDVEVKKEYDSLKPYYELRCKLIQLRKEAGITQEELAELLNTQKSNISRLESVSSKSSPRLSTIEKYAHAMGYDVEINFVPSVSVDLQK